MQAAVLALSLAVTEAERSSAREALVFLTPAVLPSPAERSEALSQAILSVLGGIRSAPSDKQARELASAVRQPLGELMKILCEEALSWPTDEQLQQALWDSDREFAAWELLEHFR
jgi:hypothetical protein